MARPMGAYSASVHLTVHLVTTWLFNRRSCINLSVAKPLVEFRTISRCFYIQQPPNTAIPIGLEREQELCSQSPWCASAISASKPKTQCSNTNVIPHITLPYPKHNNKTRVLTSWCKDYRCKTRKLITA